MVFEVVSSRFSALSPENNILNRIIQWGISLIMENKNILKEDIRIPSIWAPISVKGSQAAVRTDEKSMCQNCG